MKPIRLLALFLALTLLPQAALATLSVEESALNRRIFPNTAKTLDYQPEAARLRTDSMVIGVPDLMGETSPFWAATTGDSYAASLLYDELVFASNAGEIGPGVATYALSSGGRQVTFTIHDSVRYADGTAVTSDDFINALYLLLMPGYDGAYGLADAGIEGVDAYLAGEAASIAGIAPIDARTFSVTFGAANASALWYLAVPALRIAAAGDMRRPEGMADPSAFEAFYREALEGARQADPVQAAYGQYLPAALAPGEKGVYTKNEGYWRGTPYVGQIELLVVPVGDELAAILDGTVDIISMLGSVEAVDAVADFETGFINLYTWEGDVIGYLGMDLTDPLFADARVRKALTMGFDRETARKNRIERYGKVPTVLLFDSFNPSLVEVTGEQYAFDLEAAGRLLDEAGWTLAETGIREKDGAPLAVSLIYNAPNPIMDVVVPQMQADYRTLGIDLLAEPLPFGALEERINSGEYGMYFQARRLPSSPLLAADLFMETVGSTTDADIDMLGRLWRMASVEGDPARQTVLLELFFQELYLQLPIIPLYRRSEFLLVNARIMNLSITTAHELTADAYRIFLTDTLEGQW